MKNGQITLQETMSLTELVSYIEKELTDQNI